MKDSLFVYGTLMPNCPNSYVLENIVGKFVPATVKGKLIDAGWSASMGYPGIRLEMGNDTIHGFLFYSDNLINHWENLDIFEGVEFSRTPVIAERNNVELRIELGTAENLGKEKFDIILANINRNILISDIPTYVKDMNEGSELLLSGLCFFDVDDILEVCTEQGLKLKNKQQREEWCSLLLEK